MEQAQEKAYETAEEGNPAFVIEARDLHKSFGENHVLNGISFNLRKQENVVVLGKSGSGKSVLIKCVVGLEKPDSGTLIVLGKDLAMLKYNELTDLRKKIGFLFQGGALYDSMTVKENLEFPLKRNNGKKSREELDYIVEEALENVGLKDAIHKMPSELSGGMKKRIALARTLILKPDLVMYDEPTTGLDPVTSVEISNLMVEMQEKYKMSSVIITHDMHCARIAGNRFCVLDQGKFVKEGSYEEIKNSEEEWVRAFFI